jgi:hypothetical protein
MIKRLIREYRSTPDFHLDKIEKIPDAKGRGRVLSRAYLYGLHRITKNMV